MVEHHSQHSQHSRHSVPESSVAQSSPFVWHDKTIEEVLRFIQTHMLPVPEEEFRGWLSLFHDQNISRMEHVLLMTRQEWDSLPMKVGLRAVMEHVMGIRQEVELLTQSIATLKKNRGQGTATTIVQAPSAGVIVPDSRAYQHHAALYSAPPAVHKPKSSSADNRRNMKNGGSGSGGSSSYGTSRYDSAEEEAKYKLKLEERVHEEMAKQNHFCGYTVRNSMEVYCHECDQTLRMNIRGQARNWARHCFGVNGSCDTNHMQRFRKNMLQRQVEELQLQQQQQQQQQHHLQQQQQQHHHLQQQQQQHHHLQQQQQQQQYHSHPPPQHCQQHPTSSAQKGHAAAAPAPVPSAQPPLPPLRHLAQRLFPPNPQQWQQHQAPPTSYEMGSLPAKKNMPETRDASSSSSLGQMRSQSSPSEQLAKN